MNILLLGGNGQVGWELRRSLAVLGEVIAPSREEADLANADSLREWIDATEPQIIVNAAAYTEVDRAEGEAQTARAINAKAPALLASAARQADAWLVHYGTDYVFDGTGSAPWRESDTPHPINLYGQTKLEGEQEIQASGCHHLILRTSWVYAARGKNFLKTILRLAAQRQELRIVNDQVGAPTSAEWLADITAHILRVLPDKPELGGLYHAVASGFATWLDFGACIVDNARTYAKESSIVTQEVIGIPSSEFPTRARRPLNSRLDTAKLRATFGLHIPHWRLSVLRALDETLSGAWD